MREIRKGCLALGACIFFIWVISLVLGVFAGFMRELLLLDPWLFIVPVVAITVWSLVLATLLVSATVIMVFVIGDLTGLVFAYFGRLDAANTIDARVVWLRHKLRL